MKISIDDLHDEDIIQLLALHQREMLLHSPPESAHVLDIRALRHPKITFWSAREHDRLLGCGALQELTAQHGEIKSMRTAIDQQRKGVAQRMLRHLIQQAIQRGYQRLSLETGSMAAFAPARKLYANAGFEYCQPFTGYIEDPYSVFMTMQL